MRSHWLALAAFILIVASGSSEAKIVHRWSFATDGKDSVGTANAVLREGAAVASGKVDLNGSGAYVELPIGATVSKLTNATIEAWATWDTAQGAWARLFDIGMGQNAYMFLTPRHGRAAEGGAENSIRFAITTNGFGEEQTVNGPAQFPTAKETHVAVTIDAEKKVARLYVDGKLVATQENFTLTPSGLGTTTNNWLGGSQFFESDPTFDGSVSEFRIYDTALSEVEIAASREGWRRYARGRRPADAGRHVREAAPPLELRHRCQRPGRQSQRCAARGRESGRRQAGARRHGRIR